MIQFRHIVVNYVLRIDLLRSVITHLSR